MEHAQTKEQLLPIYADGEIGARILAAMEAYRKEYVYSPEYGADHEPTDFEQVLLEDFLNGAFTDEVSAILQEAARRAAPQPAASDEPSWGKWFDYASAPAGSYACLVSQKERGGWSNPVMQWMPAQGRAPLATDCRIMPFLMPGDPLAKGAALATPRPSTQSN